MRDVVVAGAVVLLLLGVLWAYTGQPFPNQAPLVVVESGSMMHGPDGPCLSGTRGCADFGSPTMGRLGTIDPGDLVLVKRVSGFRDVETAFGAGDRDGYGAHGDVLVYKRPHPGFDTPVIHRAALLVLVEREGCFPNVANESACRYIIPETCNARFGHYVVGGSSRWQDYCRGSREPITLDLKRGGVFLSLSSYPCSNACGARFYSGILTKGDNNQAVDQPTPYAGEGHASGIICCPVRPEWIVGKARGEIPWFGLIKLAIYGNERYACREGQGCSDPTRDAQWTVFRATAPWDIWVMLLLGVAVLVLAPVALDYGVNAWRRRRGRLE